MSNTGTVDYDALARQYGATSSQAAQPTQQVDYDALAKQYGATSSAPAPHDIQAQPARFSGDWWKEKYYELMDSGTKSLPAAGATIGATLGGAGGTAVEPGGGTALGAIGGAGIGGMTGAAAKNAIRAKVFPNEPQMTTAQTFNDISKQGLIQAGMQATGEAASLLRGPLENAAITQYQRALAPTTKVNKAIVQDITPEMMQRGIHGGLPGIEDQAEAQLDALRPQLDQAISQVPRDKIQGTPWEVLKNLQSLKKGYIVDGKIANPQAVDAINRIQDVVGQYGDDISPESLRKLRQIFDDPVAKKAGFAGGDISTQYSLLAQKKAADTIRGVLNSASPDVAALNKEMSFWLDVQKVTQESGLRQTGQQGGLMRVLGPLGAGAAGGLGFAHAGAGPGLEAAGASAATTALALAVKTPAWRTSSALFKNYVADSLASGNFQRALVLLGRFGAGGMELLPSHPPSGQTPAQ